MYLERVIMLSYLNLSIHAQYNDAGIYFTSTETSSDQIINWMIKSKDTFKISFFLFLWFEQKFRGSIRFNLNSL